MNLRRSTHTAMFEVNVFTPHQTGAFSRGSLLSWTMLVTLYSGTQNFISVLIYPNTGDSYADHTEHMTWMGKPWPLNVVEMLKKHGGLKKFGCIDSLHIGDQQYIVYNL